MWHTAIKAVQQAKGEFHHKCITHFPTACSWGSFLFCPFYFAEDSLAPTASHQHLGISPLTFVRAAAFPSECRTILLRWRKVTEPLGKREVKREPKTAERKKKQSENHKEKVEQKQDKRLNWVQVNCTEWKQAAATQREINTEGNLLLFCIAPAAGQKAEWSSWPSPQGAAVNHPSTAQLNKALTQTARLSFPSSLSDLTPNNPAWIRVGFSSGFGGEITTTRTPLWLIVQCTI